MSFDLPIAKGDKIHCLDILHALTKHVLGHVEETEEFKRVSIHCSRPTKRVITFILQSVKDVVIASCSLLVSCVLVMGVMCSVLGVSSSCLKLVIIYCVVYSNYRHSIVVVFIITTKTGT